MEIGDQIFGGRQMSYIDNKPASLALGVVIDNWNSAYPGCVQVKIIVENGKTLKSDWIPVAMPYAASGNGLYALPEVGNTVVIGYIDDCSVAPVVIGSIWGNIKADGVNAKNKLPPKIANEKNTTKVFSTPKGHMIKLEDDSEKSSIEIATSKGNKILLDEKNQKMSLECEKSKVTINGKDGSVEIDAEKKLSLKIGGTEVMSFSKDGVESKAKKLSYNGNVLELKGKQSKIEGSTVDIKSKGNLNVKSDGMVAVKGSMLKLN